VNHDDAVRLIMRTLWGTEVVDGPEARLLEAYYRDPDETMRVVRAWQGWNELCRQRGMKKERKGA
jgi:hypothetical protein